MSDFYESGLSKSIDKRFIRIIALFTFRQQILPDTRLTNSCYHGLESLIMEC